MISTISGNWKYMYTISTANLFVRLNGWSPPYRSIPKPLRNVVRKPSVPRVKMKARASGTPAKFEATPENVIRAVRRKRGSPPRITE